MGLYPILTGISLLFLVVADLTFIVPVLVGYQWRKYRTP